MNNKILITGITGNVGSEVLKHLQKKGVNVKAGVRSIEKAKEIFGNSIDYARFDFEDLSTFDEALDGVSKLFLVRPPAISDTKKYIEPFIEKAKMKKVNHIVFLSLMGIEHNLIPPHYKIEKYIKKSKIPYTFLRPSFFMQNLDTTHRYDIKERNEIYIPSGKAKVSFIDVRDIGEIGAKVLIEDGHENKAYTLTGNQALDYYEVSEIFSNVLGRKIVYTNPSSLKFRKEMINRGIQSNFVNVMVGLYMSTKLGMGKKVTGEFKQLIGREPITINQYVKDYKSSWM